MRVNFTHSEVTKGILRKTAHPVVIVSVTFSEEERALIEREKYGGYVLLECVPYNARADRDERIYYLYVRNLLNGSYEFMAENNVDAKNFEEAVVDKLKLLKVHLEEGSSAATSKTVEI
ncbi:hypothetical protein [Gymnodinialimonas ceratoperidinii]|uniref:Uncharacterized protein n=1 Tax=Gymnodinialimonas ceratoperidinii TaxID=2856823 RepID=A0A8F6U084_9RHOB|nr:hypothetical protein [Gymnodinialimonas ceratoperidinii]QXT40982.1 hypothetical protein KYE46_07095 [Gymnodinialimonas ceratoperidinii]